jgi:hypothetical protein
MYAQSGGLNRIADYLGRFAKSRTGEVVKFVLTVLVSFLLGYYTLRGEMRDMQRELDNMSSFMTLLASVVPLLTQQMSIAVQNIPVLQAQMTQINQTINSLQLQTLVQNAADLRATQQIMEAATQQLSAQLSDAVSKETILISTLATAQASVWQNLSAWSSSFMRNVNGTVRSLLPLSGQPLSWQPILLTHPDSPGGAVSYTAQQGSYYRIGRMVHFALQVQYTQWAGSPWGTFSISLPLAACGASQGTSVVPTAIGSVKLINMKWSPVSAIPVLETWGFVANYPTNGFTGGYATVVLHAAGSAQGYVTPQDNSVLVSSSAPYTIQGAGQYLTCDEP